MDNPFDLVDVKLVAPKTRPGSVPKPDLIARLRAEGSSVATVVAPAGYGKTTLLAQWAEADPRPFAWVALDHQDDDAVVFMRYITAAMHRVAPVDPSVFDALSGPGGSAWTTRFPRVGNALASSARPMVLVLDDLHAVGNQSCLDVLSELVRHVPFGSQIVISTREEPALPLARWRASGQLYEIGVGDLRLDTDEAGRLFEAAGVELDADAISQLTARTEGWPAGLYLAALSIQAGGGPAATDFVTGDHRFVAEYFRHELLDRMPADGARFLTHTSILEWMSGGICDSVLATSGSAQALEALGRTNGFVVPMDSKGEWYRYHHLFGELLRNELERSEPNLVRELSARAMAWCIANDRLEAAVPYGHAAGDTDTIAGLIDALALPVYYDSRIETLEEWLRWFGDDELTKYPALAVLSAWVHVLTGRTPESERLLALAEGATSVIPLSDGSTTIEPWVATLRAHMMRNGVEQALADAELALEQLPSLSAWRPTALLGRAVAHLLLGLVDHAKDDLLATVEQASPVGAVEELYLAQAELALLAARHGAWHEAGQRALAAQTVVDEAGLAGYSSSAIPHVATARVAIHEGRHEKARGALGRIHRLRPMLDHGLPWISIQVGVELTRAHLALGEATAARTVLTETEHLLELRPDMGALVEDVREMAERVSATSGAAGAWAMSLTGAELRLLPYLATHLTFPEIASRLFLSRNTVKTEAVSIYRKLGASSRSQAIERAVEVGFLESWLPPPANLTLEG